MIGRVLGLIICATCVVCQSQYMVEPGPKYPPTRGEVWPKPQYEMKEPKLYKLDKSRLNFEILDKSCDILTKALDRVRKLLEKQHYNFRRIRRKMKNVQSGRSERKTKAAILHKMNIDLTRPCEDYPYLGMDESYNLTVSAVSTLRSGSIWGILHGLESFVQLFYPSNDFSVIYLNGTVIQDYPRYQHRGLLLDTSRHYITVENLKTTLDAMAMNKMNVFHWHIVDDPSFPYQSERFPELSKKGAYHPTMVYSKADIQFIVNYARDRAIRVLPEIDVPGHTRSWGVAYPTLLTECYKDNEVVGLGPMDPINNFTYTLLEEFIQEVQEWFPDKYFHLGGDEVDLSCWESNPYLLDYMLSHNMSSVKQFHSLFMKRVIPLLAGNTQPIVWQEVFDEHVPLSNNTLIQVWKDGWIQEMQTILRNGHSVLFSAEWYLSMLAPGGDWDKFYEADPRREVADEALAARVVGGEACMWGEYVDDNNLIARVWPRGSAVAERLWSFASLDEPGGSSDAEDLDRVRHRIEEHACRMVRRGVPAQPPNAQGFCVH